MALRKHPEHKAPVSDFEIVAALVFLCAGSVAIGLYFITG